MTSISSSQDTFLGSGTYGSVRADTIHNSDPNRKEDRAIKEFKRTDYLTDINSTAELDAHFRIQSPYLVKGFRMTGKVDVSFELQMEQILGTLDKLSEGEKTGEIPYENMKKLFLHLSLGLQCLHRNNFLHLDISYFNCMYSGSIENPIGRLIDYGLGASTERDIYGNLLPVLSNQERVTFYYRPPENLVDSTRYSDKTDIWSLGMVFLQIIFTQGKIHEDTHQKSIDKKKIKDNMQLFSKIYHRESEEFFTSDFKLKLPGFLVARFSSKDMDDAIDLLYNMLTTNVEARFNINQVVNHPFFSNIKDEVRRTAGNICHTKQITATSDTVPFDDVRFNALQYITSILIKEFPEPHHKLRSILLFKSIDIYMRVQSLRALETIRETVWESKQKANQNAVRKTEQEEMNEIAEMCILVAFRLYFLYSDLPWIYHRDVDRKSKAAVWEYEIYVLNLIEGVINRDFLYEAASSAEELALVYYELTITRNYELLSNYLHLNPVEYMAEIRTKIRTTNCASSDIQIQHTPKICSIRDVLKHAALLVPRDYENQVFGIGYLLRTLKDVFRKESLEMFTLAIDIYIQAMNLLQLKQAPEDKIYEAVHGICIISYKIIRGNEAPLPSTFPRVDLLSSQQVGIQITEYIGSAAYTNRFYTEATCMRHLSFLYINYIYPGVPDSGIDNIFDTYASWIPESIFKLCDQKYSKPGSPKNASIEQFFSMD